MQDNIPVFEGASFSAIVGLGDGPSEEDKSLLQKYVRGSSTAVKHIVNFFESSS